MRSSERGHEEFFLSDSNNKVLLTGAQQSTPARREIAKGALAVFLPVFALAAAVTEAILFVSSNAEMMAYRNREGHVVAIQAENINSDIRQVSSDLAILSHEKTMERLWDDGGAPFPGALADLSEVYLSTSIYRRLYDQVRLLDENGMEIVRVDLNNGQPAVVPQEELQNKKGRYYFEDAFKLSRGEVFVSPLDLNIERGEIEGPLKPMIRFATPVFDQRGEKRGIVMLNYLGALLLARFSIQADMSKGSQAMLLNADGHWLKGPNPKDEWGFMYEDRKDRTFPSLYPEAWEKIKSTESCQFETREGMFSSKTVYPLLEGQKSSTGTGEAFARSKAQLEAKDYRWKVVSLAPSKVLYSAGKNRRMVAVSLLSLLSLTLLFGSWRVAKAGALRRQSEENRENLIVELRDSLAQIKTLRGIVPICTHCKKIRDTKGYWQQVETYIGNHSEAEFSHSLCDDCMRELYPNEAGQLLGDTDSGKNK